MIKLDSWIATYSNSSGSFSKSWGFWWSFEPCIDTPDLTLQFNGCPMRQIRHGVGLSAASGAISQDAHGLAAKKLDRIEIMLCTAEGIILIWGRHQTN